MRILAVLFLVSTLAQPATIHATPGAPDTPTRNSETAATNRGASIVAALARDEIDKAAVLAREAATAGDADGQFLYGFLHDVGLGVEFSLEEGTKWQDMAAKQGHVWSRLYLAWKWRTGTGVKQADAARAQELQGDLLQRETPPRLLDTDWLGMNGWNFTPRFTRAAALIRHRAEAGDGLASYNFAQYLLYGLVGRPDPNAHLEWLRRAAQQGNAEAAARLDMYYGLGLFVAEDKAEAARWERRAADLGHAPSQHALGRASERAGDTADARNWLSRAAAQDHIPSLNRLADLLRKSESGNRESEFAEALRLSRRAAELGSAEALGDVAGMYRSGHSVAKDPTKAFDLYRQAAEGGYAYAAMMAGWMLSRGEVGSAPDHTAASGWFERAAASGDAVAMRELGRLYFDGQGVPVDKQKSFEWMERAARDGDAWAQQRLGWMLREGIGVERDDEEAVNWFRLAAKQGDAASEAHLGYHYLRGLGVSRDAVQGFDHLVLALRSNDDDWMVGNFAHSFTLADEAERKIIVARLAALANAPDFGQEPGALPEACYLLAAVIAHSQGPELLARIIDRLVSLERPQSAPHLAKMSFLGYKMPYDLAKARAWAAQVQRTGGRNSKFLVAFIESAAAPDDATRQHYRKELEELAHAGNADARAVLRDRQDVFVLPPERLSNMPDHQELGRREAALAPRPEMDQPQLLFSVSPVYPFELRASGLEGTVSVVLVVEKDGSVGTIRIESSTHPLFSLAVTAAVKHWRFAPALNAGQPVSRRVGTSFPFTLNPTTAP